LKKKSIINFVFPRKYVENWGWWSILPKTIF